MYEICRLLAPKKKKTAKVRAPRKPAIRVGCAVKLFDKDCVVVRRDTRYANAWFVSYNGVEINHSFSRDMLDVC